MNARVRWLILLAASAALHAALFAGRLQPEAPPTVRPPTDVLVLESRERSPPRATTRTERPLGRPAHDATTARDARPSTSTIAAPSPPEPVVGPSPSEPAGALSPSLAPAPKPAVAPTTPLSLTLPPSVAEFYVTAPKTDPARAGALVVPRAPAAAGEFPLAPSGQGRLRYDGAPFGARVAADGQVHFDDHSLSATTPSLLGFDPLRRRFNPEGTQPGDLLELSGHFDLTDELMRRHGEDPYRVVKEKLLAQTFDERARMADQARRQGVRQALAALPSELAALWRDPSHSARERRHRIAILWLDADEQYGLEARRMIEAFVRLHLPAGSADQYADDELAEINRGCKTPFRPYSNPVE